MKLGYAASAGETDIYDTIDYAYKNGFNAVEININMPIFFPEVYDSKERKTIRNYLIDKNIELTLHAPEDITLMQLQKSIREATINRLKEVIDFGNDIGASRMTMHIGSSVCFTLVDRKSYVDEIFADEYKNTLKESLVELCKYSKEKLMLCIENSGRFPKKIVQEVLDELLEERDDIYLTWDIGHSYENKYNEVEFFLKHVNKIKTCHLHDNNGKSDHQIIGTGDVDFRWHIDKLKDSDVVYIIEVRPRDNALRSLSEFKKFM